MAKGDRGRIPHLDLITAAMRRSRAMILAILRPLYCRVKTVEVNYTAHKAEQGANPFSIREISAEDRKYSEKGKGDTAGDTSNTPFTPQKISLRNFLLKRGAGSSSGFWVSNFAICALLFAICFVFLIASIATIVLKSPWPLVAAGGYVARIAIQRAIRATYPRQGSQRLHD